MLYISIILAQCDSYNEAVVEVILAAKETRGSKYYQVEIIVCVQNMCNICVYVQVLWLEVPWEPETCSYSGIWE